MKLKSVLLLLLIVSWYISFSQVNEAWKKVTGSAMLENRSCHVLERICDEAGGRIMGSPANIKAIGIVREELHKLGIETKEEYFDALLWERGDDVVTVTYPFTRILKAVALGYVDSVPQFSSKIVYAGYGTEKEFKAAGVKGMVVLVTRETPKDEPALQTIELIRNALKYGASAMLFITDKPGTHAIARTANFRGERVVIPVFNITYEEGKWLQRLCEKNIRPSVTVHTRSHCLTGKASNVTVSFKGKTDERIVIGAHIDSWDLGQGAVDNGQGTAILFEIARLLAEYSPENYYTIDLVWFNGEELGLTGAHKYADMHRNDKIITMINMDMTGAPKGFNIMGFDEYRPLAQNLADRLTGFEMKDGVSSQPWTNSDHMPFMLHGIPTICVNGHLDEPMYKYYHESGDTYDKVSCKYIAEAAAVITILAIELANDRTIQHHNLTEEQTIEFLKKYKLDETLRKQGEWTFDN
jgi:Iap family predicted aminopeptidase